MTISLIAAVDKQRGIGVDNKMPWHIKEDFQWFRFHTMHKTVVMGRNTFGSIGIALPQRNNIVLSSHDIDFRPEVKVLHSVAEVLAYTATDREVMVIGGASVYKQFLPFATRLYLTEIDKEFECDTFFPDVDHSKFNRFYYANGVDDVGFKYSFNVYKRKG